MANKTKTSEDIYTLLIEFITQNQDHFYRFTYNYVKNEQAALDVIQNAIYNALTHYHSLKQIEFLKTWFYRILINESLTYIKKNKKLVLMQDIIDTTSHVDKYKVDELDLFNKVNNLPTKYKTIILLRFYEDMTLEEIGEITKTNLNTVKSRLYKALKILKLNYEESELYEQNTKYKKNL